MKSLKIIFPFLIFFLAISAILPAQKVDSLPAKQPGFFIGSYVGVPSYCTKGITIEAVELSMGSRQIVLTTRFYRTRKSLIKTPGRQDYFFEDAIELGWKKSLNHSFTNTISAGYANLAFEDSTIWGDEIGFWNFTKVDGFILEEKLAFTFQKRNHTPSAFGIAANYYFIFNSIKPVHGFSVGIDLNLEDLTWEKRVYGKRMHKNVMEEEEERKVEKVQPIPCDSIPFRNIIRTNFMAGILHTPHIDFEHRYNKRWGWGISAMHRSYFSLWSMGYAIQNPDYLLDGYGVYADLIFYEPFCNLSGKNRYMTFAFRTGYRNFYREKFPYEDSHYTLFYLTRSRQDIVTDFRISYIFPSNAHLLIDLYLCFGARTSYYETQFFHTGPTYQIWEGKSFQNYPNNGCYVRSEYSAGIEIGFGW